MARYRGPAIAFHWIMFVLVVMVGILGLLHDSWPKKAQAYWINIHAVLGLLFWMTLFARFAWRRLQPPPALPSDVGAFSRHFSRPVHLALYGLMFVIPIIGIITFVFHGRVFDFGLFRIDPGVPSNRAIFHPTEDIHGYLAYALFALATVHASVALWHQFVLRDELILRMWPAPREPS